MLLHFGSENYFNYIRDRSHLKDSKFISAEEKIPKSMDFHFLREKATEFSQQISGEKWTDYNLHDPGVTILEQFAYALTDIAFRTNLPIEDLLFSADDNEHVSNDNALYSAPEVFMPGPITEKDYRILILNRFIRQISNCWVEKIEDHLEGMNGLYQVKIKLRDFSDKRTEEKVLSEVHSFLMAHRNLCEDFEAITILEPKHLSLDLELEILQEALADEVMLEVLSNVESYLNPKVRFYSPDELEENGQSLDEIFDVPSYRHGVILKSELKPKQERFYSSSIENIIKSIKGVRSIQKLRIFIDGIPVHGDILNVENNSYFTLFGEDYTGTSTIYSDTKLKVLKVGAECEINRRKLSAAVYNKMTVFNRVYADEPMKSARPREINREEVRNFDSIQYQFPMAYGIGDSTPSSKEGPQRKAKSSQLKAYLLFFDQIMANHLAQLSEISTLFSVTDIYTPKFKTYYTNWIADDDENIGSLLQKPLWPIHEIDKALDELDLFLAPDSLLYKEEKGYLQEMKREKQASILLEIEKWVARNEKMDEETILADRFFQDRNIYTLFLKGINDETSEESKADFLEQFRTAAKSELEQRDSYGEFRCEDLEQIQARFDNKLDRKGRLLSHILARFGEGFKHDFFQKFTKSFRFEDQEHLPVLMNDLKSQLIRRIKVINRFKAQGLIVSKEEEIYKLTPLQEKINLLFNLPHQKLSQKDFPVCKVNRLTGADLDIQKEDALRQEVVTSSRIGNENDKVHFLINSKDALKLLFKFGINKDNYLISTDATGTKVYFNPLNIERPTLLFRTDKLSSAQDKIDKLIENLYSVNSKNERYWFVEHVLLRIHELKECNFWLIDKQGNRVFKSVLFKEEGIQRTDARDTLILAGYADNYRITKNEEGNFQVKIKSKKGVYLAVSKKSFVTAIEAEDFINDSVEFYLSHKNSVDECAEFGNKTRFSLNLLDENEVCLLTSVKTIYSQDQADYEAQMIHHGKESHHYKIKKLSDDCWSLVLKDSKKRNIAETPSSFETEKEAKAMRSYLINQFERIIEHSKPLLRFILSKPGQIAPDKLNLKLSVVHPNWTIRFGNEEFLQIFKQTVIESTPAHLAVQFIALDQNRLMKFEESYAQLLSLLRDNSRGNVEKISKLKSQIISYLEDG